jgi:hypothetical protein
MRIGGMTSPDEGQVLFAYPSLPLMNGIVSQRFKLVFHYLHLCFDHRVVSVLDVNVRCFCL